MAKTVAATAPSEARTVSPSPWRQALEDLRPVPGRAALTWRVALLCALVTGAGMMFHIPEAAISCYLVIFLMKPDAVVNTGTGIGFLILLPGLIALLVWIINLTSGSTAHIMAAIVISSILFLYLGAATQLGEQGSVAALIVAFLLTLIVQAPFGEAATFALREAWAMAAMPMILMIGFNLLLGFSPVALLRDKLRARLGAAAEALETGDATALRECLREGNGAFEPQALAARLLRLVPRAEARQIATDIRAGFALMLAVSALPAELRPDRRAALAAAIRAAHGALGEGLAPPPPNTGTRDLLADIDPAERAVWVALERLAGTPEPEVVPEPKVPFIAPDALSNPAYTRFALKTTAAAVICFLIYTAIDWQGIHTAMITCYVAALATTGETVHKLALRIVGCLIGAALGVAAIFFVIPHIDDIGSLMALVFFGCLVGAWVSTGPERISYAGVQVALAFLLTVLQGFGPSISLDTAQGRIFGILLGNLVVYLMFTRVWPAPVEGEVRAMFARALAGLARMARLAPASRANAVGGAAAVASLAGRRAARRSLGALVLGLALAGCASDATNMAPVAPDQPWTPRGDEETGTWSLARPGPRTRSDGVADFAIPMDSERAQLVLTPGGDPERSYALPELIDLAQRTNPATRTAWQQARQAALAVGMVEATYLPVITAGVIGGAQELTLPLPEALGENISVENRQQGSAQILALQWLLFDFGQREALATAAKHAAVAANILFNGTHQRLIFEVSQAYYAYGAAVQRRGFAEAALGNAKSIRAAVDARAAQGLATSMETAQAHQAVAQAELRRVRTEGEERDAYQNLLAAVGVSVQLNIDTAGAARRPLPEPAAAPLEQSIRQALSRRPDVAASYAALQGSKAGIEAARADYLPKVYAGGNLSSGSGDFDISGLPAIGQLGSGDGLLLGVTVPLYDGGLRDARISDAKSRAATAADEFQRVQTAAVTEIVAARNALRTALESHSAAAALVAAASTTYDAALAAYRNGVGTVDAATAADTALLDAREAQAEAHAAALIGAVNLAFAVGSLTSRESLP